MFIENILVWLSSA